MGTSKIPIEWTAPATKVPALLCHPGLKPALVSFKAVCPYCSSFWDIQSGDHGFEYTDSYPIDRLHWHLSTGQLKVSTLVYWLSKSRIDPQDHVICEVGFGGGFYFSLPQQGHSNCLWDRAGPGESCPCSNAWFGFFSGISVRLQTRPIAYAGFALALPR